MLRFTWRRSAHETETDRETERNQQNSLGGAAFCVLCEFITAGGVVGVGGLMKERGVADGALSQLDDDMQIRYNSISIWH